LIIAGDINAHSPMWNSRCQRRSHYTGFWENLFEELVIWNEEEATRHSSNARNHSIIDVTASTPGIELERAIGGAEEATGSDHEVLFWRLLGEGTPITGGSSMGWNVADLRADKDKLKEARSHWLQKAGNRAPFPEAPSAEEVEDEAMWIHLSMAETLNTFAKKRRVCARSKRWWTPEISELRTALGRAKRQRTQGRITRRQVKDARRVLRRAIRKAKRDTWNNFLQEAD